MTEAIIVAIIVSGVSLAGTVIGSMAGIRTANKVTVYRITCLEAKMDKHNNIVERLTKVEATVCDRIPELDKKLDAQTEQIYQRMDDKEKSSDQRFDSLSKQLARHA